MITRINIMEYEALKKTTIDIDCGLLYKDNHFIKELVELINRYEKEEDNEDTSNND